MCDPMILPDLRCQHYNPEIPQDLNEFIKSFSDKQNNEKLSDNWNTVKLKRKYINNQNTMQGTQPIRWVIRKGL